MLLHLSPKVLDFGHMMAHCDQFVTYFADKNAQISVKYQCSYMFRLYTFGICLSKIYRYLSACGSSKILGRGDQPSLFLTLVLPLRKAARRGLVKWARGQVNSSLRAGVVVLLFKEAEIRFVLGGRNPSLSPIMLDYIQLVSHL